MTHCRTCDRAEHFVVRSLDLRTLCQRPRGSGWRCELDLGWGMFPEQLAAPKLADGSFMWISDVPLCWQCWKLDSPMMKRITDTVRSAATDLRRRPR
jgi:hypothetical protein